MSRLIIIIVLTVLTGGMPAYSRTAFYIVAHEDDWQLFMNPNAYYDVQDPNAKVVFVYVTSGDTGLGPQAAGLRTVPYYVARESAANRAVRFMADINTTSEESVWDTVVVRGHTLHHGVYKNTVSYFLRLPDGNGDGSGFAKTGSWSLERFRAGKVHQGRTVDESTLYASWSDLVGTIRQLINDEMAGSSDAWINIPESDAALISRTHSDHVNTSSLAQDAIAGFKCINRAFYLDYSTASKPINLSAEQQQIQAGVFAVTAAGVSQFGYQNTWDTVHRSVLGRQYLRIDHDNNCGK